MTPRGTRPAPTPEIQTTSGWSCAAWVYRTLCGDVNTHYHVCVHFLFAVDVGSGSGKLQQLVRLVHNQRGLELTQPEQVAAEHPAQNQGLHGRTRPLSAVRVQTCVLYVPVDLVDVRRGAEEEAASLQHHQNQVRQKLLIGDLTKKQLTSVTKPKQAAF